MTAVTEKAWARDPQVLDDLRRARALTKRIDAAKTRVAEERRTVLRRLVVDRGVPVIDVARFCGLTDAAIHATLRPKKTAPTLEP